MGQVFCGGPKSRNSAHTSNLAILMPIRKVKLVSSAKFLQTDTNLVVLVEWLKNPIQAQEVAQYPRLVLPATARPSPKAHIRQPSTLPGPRDGEGILIQHQVLI